MTENHHHKIPKFKKSFNYQTGKISMHIYLNVKKCLSAIDNVEYINENKLNETLFHIKLHLESNPFIQIQHVIKSYHLGRYLKNFYEFMEFNVELLLYKNLLNITLIKSNNNIQIYLSKMKKSFNDFKIKKCDLFLNFFANLILNGLSGKYEFIISTIINHVRATGGIINSIDKVGQNLNGIYYLIMNEARCIDLRNASHAYVNDVKEIVMTSQSNNTNQNSDKKKKKKKTRQLNLGINNVNYTKTTLVTGIKTVFATRKTWQTQLIRLKFQL